MPLDPSGHIKISVSDFAKSRAFYSALFAHLGHKQIADDEDSAAWVSPAGMGFWIEQAEKARAYEFGQIGLHHICFKVESREAVDRIYNEFVLPQKISVFDAPQEYLQYTPEYYAVFFADPDGMKLEVAVYF